MDKAMKLVIRTNLENDRGATLILVALLMIVFLGISALAVDGAHLYAVRNELQNAADAGALAGARFLYDESGIEVNPGANQIAYDAAIQNKALAKTVGATAVDVNWTEGQNSGINVDVQRGHWRFSDHKFYANDYPYAIDISKYSEDELDDMNDFINAVRVVARRQASPAAAFFARIFGYSQFELAAEAVAYIGFAGTLAPGEVDLPIVICAQSITNNISAQDCPKVGYNCNIGYMLSDGEDKNTAAWTDFFQPETGGDCGGAASTEDMREVLTCSEANPAQIILGRPLRATNGVNENLIDNPQPERFPSLMNCWRNAKNDTDDDGVRDEAIDTDGDGVPDKPWNVTLPTVNCPDLKVDNCMKTCGAVNVNIIWILEKAQKEKIDEEAPRKMWNPKKGQFWSSDSSDGVIRWNSFVDEFNLKRPNGDPAYANFNEGERDKNGYLQKSIYFMPDCSEHELKGKTGGSNYGVLAEVPVLVK